MKSLLAIVFSASTLMAMGDDFVARFEPGLKGWTLKNMNNAVEVKVDKYKGKNALVISGLPDKKGTAWELAGEPFAVKAGDEISVAVRACGTVKKMRFAHGYHGSYISGIVWYDAEGKRVSVPLGFGYNISADEWRISSVCGKVPQGAVKAQLLLGADTPNFTSNDVFAVSDAIVRTIEPIAAKNRVTLRDDGVVLVGGKPFFPIGIYAVSECEANGNSIDRAFRDLKAAGFNLVHRTSPNPMDEYERFLDLADKHNLKVFTLPVPSYKSDFYFDSLIPKTKKHDCILAWYLADDTASHVDPEVVADRDRLCKLLDKDHLTLQADAVMMGGAFVRYREYVHTTDIFLPELYPVYKKIPHGGEVAEIAANMRVIRDAVEEAGAPVKSVWPIIQHFDGWGAWHRFPTFAELRGMSWQAIINGGRGITWYAYHSRSGRGRGIAASPQYQRELMTVSREIASVSQDLVSRDAARQPRVEILVGPKIDAFGSKPVTALLKSGVSPLLIVGNTTTNSLKAKISLEGFCDIEMVSGKKAAPQMGLGSFVDEFEPYAVHLYRLKRKGGNAFLVAHRGDIKRFPQNSEAAFRSAAELGAGMIELDVRRCKTGELIVIGEPGLPLTTDGTGTIFEASFDYLRSLSACSPKDFGDKFKGKCRIPTLAEALDSIPRDVPYINCHCIGGTEAETAKIIAKKGRLSQAFIAAEGIGRIKARKAVPEIMICNMTRPALGSKTWTHEEHFRYARETVEGKYEFLQYIGKNNVPPVDVVEYLHDNGVKVSYVICEDPDRRAEIFAKSGVDFIFTNDLPDERNMISCAGEYTHHLQGVATDGTDIFWSFTSRIVRTDRKGKILAVCEAPSHQGDLCVKDGVVYVAVNRGRFNQENEGKSMVSSYDAKTLNPIRTWLLPDMPHGAGGMTVKGDRFYVVGGLPATHECNYVYEYTSDFKLVKRHELKTGFTLMGVQTAAFEDGKFYLGIYGGKGNPPGVLRVAEDFSSFERFTGKGNVGMIKLDGCWFVGVADVNAETGKQVGYVKAADGFCSNARRYAPAKNGGELRIYFAGQDKGKWVDCGYRLRPDGYRPLTQFKDVFLANGKKKQNNKMPAVCLDETIDFSIPDLVRGVRRAAEQNEALAICFPGNRETIKTDPKFAGVLAAVIREAKSLGVKIVQP